MRRQTDSEETIASVLDTVFNAYKEISNYVLQFEKNKQALERLEKSLDAFYKESHLDGKTKKHFQNKCSVLFGRESNENKKAAALGLQNIIFNIVHELKVQCAKVAVYRISFNIDRVLDSSGYIGVAFICATGERIKLFKELLELRIKIKKCPNDSLSDSLKELVKLDSEMILKMKKADELFKMDAYASAKERERQRYSVTTSTESNTNTGERIRYFFSNYDELLLNQLQADEVYSFSPDINYLCAEYLVHVVATKEAYLKADKYYQYAVIFQHHPDVLLRYCLFLLETDAMNANQYIQQSMDGDYPEAFYQRAMQYEEGIGIQQNRQRALEHYRKAMQSGHQKAKESIKEMYQNGQIPKPDQTILKDPEQVEQYLFHLQNGLCDQNILSALLTNGDKKSSQYPPMTKALLLIAQQYAMKDDDIKKPLKDSEIHNTFQIALYQAVIAHKPYIVEQLLKQCKAYDLPVPSNLLSIALAQMNSINSQDGDDVVRQLTDYFMIIKHLRLHGFVLTQEEQSMFEKISNSYISKRFKSRSGTDDVLNLLTDIIQITVNKAATGEQKKEPTTHKMDLFALARVKRLEQQHKRNRSCFLDTVEAHEAIKNLSNVDNESDAIAKLLKLCSSLLMNPQSNIGTIKIEGQQTGDIVTQLLHQQKQFLCDLQREIADIYYNSARVCQDDGEKRDLAKTSHYFAAVAAKYEHPKFVSIAQNNVFYHVLNQITEIRMEIKNQHELITKDDHKNKRLSSIADLISEIATVSAKTSFNCYSKEIHEICSSNQELVDNGGLIYKKIKEAIDNIDSTMCRFLENLSNISDLSAYSYLHGRYLYLIGQSDNAKKALRYACQLQHPDALVLLGTIYNKESNYKEGAKLIEQAMELGCAKAFLTRCTQLNDGEGMAKNKLLAVEYLRQAMRFGLEDDDIPENILPSQQEVISLYNHLVEPEQLAQLIFDSSHLELNPTLIRIGFFLIAGQIDKLCPDTPLSSRVLLQVLANQCQKQCKLLLDLYSGSKEIPKFFEIASVNASKLANKHMSCTSRTFEMTLEEAVEKSWFYTAEQILKSRKTVNYNLLKSLLGKALTNYKEVAKTKLDKFAIIKLLLTHGATSNIEHLECVLKLNDPQLTRLTLKALPSNTLLLPWINQQFIQQKNYPGLFEFCQLLPNRVYQSRDIIDLVSPLIMDDGFVRFLKQHFDHRLSDISSDAPVNLSEQMIKIIYVIAQLDCVKGFDKISDAILTTYILVYPIVKVVVPKVLKFDAKQILLRLMRCDQLSISFSDLRLSFMTNTRIPITKCTGNYPKQALIEHAFMEPIEKNNVVDEKTEKDISEKPTYLSVDAVKFRFLLVHAMTELLKDEAMKPQIKIIMWQILHYKNTNLARLFRPDFDDGIFQRTIYPQSALEELQKLYKHHFASSQQSQIITATTEESLWQTADNFFKQVQKVFITDYVIRMDKIPADFDYASVKGKYILTKAAPSSKHLTYYQLTYVDEQGKPNKDNGELIGLTEALNKLPRNKQPSAMTTTDLHDLNKLLEEYEAILNEESSDDGLQRRTQYDKL